MVTAQPTAILSIFAVLALVLAVTGLCGVLIALQARREARRNASEARAALSRAALAESALADIRHRRSAATSQGNRTRAEARRAARLAMADELRIATAKRKAPPQSEFPFEPSETAHAQ